MNNSEKNTLVDLACISEDACQFYESAAKKAESQQMTSTFERLHELHKDVHHNIQQYINGQAIEGDIHETTAGKLARFWGEMIADVSDKTDSALVVYLEEAEDRCMHAFEAALENDDIQASTKMFLRGEFVTLRKCHDYMRELKEFYKHAA